jgi:diguanylate cyclase (GGDEF)-like protein
MPLALFQTLIALVGLWLIGRLTFRAHAYRSWRALIFLGLSVVAFTSATVLHITTLIWPPGNLTLAQVLNTLFAIGLVGVLWENIAADQQRHKDSQKLMEQWRLASNLANKRSHELEVLSEITRELASSLDLREVLQAVVDRALRIGDADAVTVYVVNRDTGELTDYHVTASNNERLAKLPPPRANGLTMTVVKTGQAAYITNVPEHPLYAAEPYPELQAIASLPLRLDDETVGVMNVGYTRPHDFDDAEMRLLNSLASSAAVAVRNAALHERIAKLAVTDELTGLANRRRFLEMVRAEMQRARRYERPLTLIMVDLDRLKQINDQNGHAAGDAMLRGVAQCLRASVRDTDLPARLGGDEFAALLPETTRDAAMMIAERIRMAVQNFSTVVNGVTIQSTVSIGLVSREAGELQDLPTLIHLADDALYKSKTSGRNSVTAIDNPLATTTLPAPQKD